MQSFRFLHQCKWHFNICNSKCKKMSLELCCEPDSCYAGNLQNLDTCLNNFVLKCKYHLISTDKVNTGLDPFFS